MTTLASPSVMPRPKRRINPNRTNLYLDIVLLVAFVADMEFNFTGLRLHELIGVFLGIALLLHLVLHWKWIASITRTFFKTMLHESRLNYVLNWALVIDMGVLVISGLFISRTLGLNLASLSSLGNINWEQWHRISADLSLLIVALHIALHWKWILTHAGKFLRIPVRLTARNR